MALLGICQKYWQKYWLRYLLPAVVCLVAVPAHGHYMGKAVPIGFTGEKSVHLAAQVIASFFEEQMGRETKLVVTGSSSQCIQSVRDREFPMAVVPDAAEWVLPKGVLKLEGMLGAPGMRAIFIKSHAVNTPSEASVSGSEAVWFCMVSVVSSTTRGSAVS